MKTCSVCFCLWIGNRNLENQQVEKEHAEFVSSRSSQMTSRERVTSVSTKFVRIALTQRSPIPMTR